MLAEQARCFRPSIVALSDEPAAEKLKSLLPPGTELLSGPAAMTELVRRSQPDVVLSGVVGSAGLEPTLAAIEVGATLAIANKETLVMAGAIVMPAARKAGVAVLPVDSEHSAIFQCLAAGKRQEVARVVLTASGGRCGAGTVRAPSRRPSRRPWTIPPGRWVLRSPSTRPR